MNMARICYKLQLGIAKNVLENQNLLVKDVILFIVVKVVKLLIGHNIKLNVKIFRKHSFLCIHLSYRIFAYIF